MKLVALDLGDRRIGLAVGFGPSGPVIPAGYIFRRTFARDLENVLETSRRKGVEGYVVGVPYNSNGGLGKQALLALGFIRQLRKMTTVPVYEVDESFTSVEAEAILREAGHKPSQEKGLTDATAAMLILQRFLDQPANPA